MWLDTKTSRECDDTFCGSIRLMGVWNGLLLQERSSCHWTATAERLTPGNWIFYVLDAPYQRDSTLELGPAKKPPPGKDAK